MKQTAKIHLRNTVTDVRVLSKVSATTLADTISLRVRRSLLSPLCLCRPAVPKHSGLGHRRPPAASSRISVIPLSFHLAFPAPPFPRHHPGPPHRRSMITVTLPSYQPSAASPCQSLPITACHSLTYIRPPPPTPTPSPSLAVTFCPKYPCALLGCPNIRHQEEVPTPEALIKGANDKPAKPNVQLH